MDICYVINHLKGDGAQRLILKIIDNNTNEDIQFTTCAIESYNPLIPEFERAGSTVVTFDARSKFDIPALRRMFNYFRQTDFDLLHAHLPYSQISGRVFGKLGGIPVIISTQHNVPENYHHVERVMERATRPIDHVTVAVSNGVKQQFENESHSCELNLTSWKTIHNGIDANGFNRRVRGVDTVVARNRWEIDIDDTVFLNVSRYVPAKAQQDIIRAMATIRHCDPDVHLFLVGGGRLEGSLRQTVVQLGLEDQVTITGRVSDQSIREFYAIADVFVTSSVHEGLPTTILEAMASELPVVATDIPGVRELITDDSGILVQPRSPPDLAEGMTKMQTKKRQRRYGQNGFRRVSERFDISRIVDEHLELYRTLSDSAVVTDRFT